MKTTTVRIPDDFYEALKKSADRNHRSVHGEILYCIERYLKFYSRLKPEEVDEMFYSEKEQEE